MLQAPNAARRTHQRVRGRVGGKIEWRVEPPDDRGPIARRVQQMVALGAADPSSATNPRPKSGRFSRRCDQPSETK